MMVALAFLWVVRAACLLPPALVVMLALGDAHVRWPQVPALPFLVVWALIFATDTVLRLVKGWNEKDLTWPQAKQ